MKVTIVLLATVVGLDSCGNPADAVRVEQPYDTIEQCLAAVEVITALDHVTHADCVSTSTPTSNR